MTHQLPFKAMLLAFIILFGMTACNEDFIEMPDALTLKQQLPDPLPQQQQLPNPLPSGALVGQLRWSDTDHQTLVYNPQGQVSHLLSQWQYVQGDPSQIHTFGYDFQYDAQNRPIQLTMTNGYFVKYFYNGNLIQKTQEFLPNGIISQEVTYHYAKGRITHEIQKTRNTNGELGYVRKHVFSYDNKGNLQQVKTYLQNENLQYVLEETTTYSGFDDKVNPTSWLLRYPYLPQMRWQFNNPQREVRQIGQGAPQISTNAYEYNAQGLPARKSTVSSSGTTVTTQYLY